MTAPRHETPMPSAAKPPFVFRALYALALASTVIITIAGYTACRQGAPRWALLMILGAGMSNVPLGAALGYLWHVPRAAREVSGTDLDGHP